jgi:ABC-type polysaccharide/polyol phosphate export permease
MPRQSWLFLCVLFYAMPWYLLVPDPFYVHVASIAASTTLVIVCALLSRAMWSTVIQFVESTCVIWQSQIIMNWDNQQDIFYLLHDDFMLLAFGIELLFLATQTPIYRTLRDALSNALRCAFLALVRVYPSQRVGHDTHNIKGGFNAIRLYRATKK